uniref:Dematin actin binding protein n=1 Tax=Cyprinus carpio TaxID=7962 RepID=A0A8C1WKA4_CYPCA
PFCSALPPQAGTAPSSQGPSAPGSPARMDNQVIGYKDLAAIPKDKAILEVERPDLMVYEPHFNISALDHMGLSRSRERSMSPHSISPPPSPEVRHQDSMNWSHSAADVLMFVLSPSSDGQTGTSHSKHDVIIESSKFPAAQPPDPNQPSKIETEYWPCPPSLATMEIEKKAAKQGKEMEDDEFEDLTEDAKRLQEQELQKIPSNLGKLILKEEIEKSVLIRRKTQPLTSMTIFHWKNKAPSIPHILYNTTKIGRSKLPPGVDRTRLEVNHKLTIVLKK